MEVHGIFQFTDDFFVTNDDFKEPELSVAYDPRRLEENVIFDA